MPTKSSDKVVIFIVAKKSSFRSDFKKILSNLDSRWLIAASHAISKQISALMESEIEYDISQILCYASFFPGEVDLTPLIAEQINARTIYLPIIHPDSRMTFISIGQDWKELAQSGESGIPEPTESSGKSFDPSLSSQSIILVPGLAFDRTGNRLGRGRGYYDRFLSRPQNRNLVKVGVCWEIQLVDEIPTESHDIVMDWICHERGMIKTGISFEEE